MFSIPFELEKSATIDMSPEDVFAAVSSFKTWPNWSPWLCQEPSCPVTVEGKPGEVGHSQAWDGTFIGSGTMRLTAQEPNKSLDYDLEFLKPWKSKSQAGFRFVPKGESTEVTWWMKGSLPIFLFFMKKMMTAMVGSDYSRGLSMLKELIETGSVPSKTDVKGVVDGSGFHYVGKRRACSVSDVGPAMEEDFTALRGLLDSSKLPEPDHIFSIYHKYNMVKGTCEYTSGLAYKEKPKVNGDLETGQLPSHKALRVDHEGPYRHLGNAWSAAMGCARAKHKVDKTIPMYEIYSNNPHETPEEEHKVEIHVPVKG